MLPWPIAKDLERLGYLVAVDGSLVDSTLSMIWADYRQGAKKAKVRSVTILVEASPRK